MLTHRFSVQGEVIGADFKLYLRNCPILLVHVFSPICKTKTAATTGGKNQLALCGLSDRCVIGHSGAGHDINKDDKMDTGVKKRTVVS